MNEESTTGLSPVKLARLLAVGALGKSEGTEGNPAQAKAELLRARLAGKLPLDSEVFDPLPEILKAFRPELQPLAGRPLGEVLLDAATDVSVLRTIKDYFKELAASSLSDAQDKTAVALYYAAIASALVFHGEKISSLAYEQLKDGLVMLLTKSWIPLELKDLYQKAHRACQGHVRPLDSTE